jgi:hypothetical protein
MNYLGRVKLSRVLDPPPGVCRSRFAWWRFLVFILIAATLALGVLG